MPINDLETMKLRADKNLQFRLSQMFIIKMLTEKMDDKHDAVAPEKNHITLSWIYTLCCQQKQKKTWDTKEGEGKCIVHIVNHILW